MAAGSQPAQDCLLSGVKSRKSHQALVLDASNVEGHSLLTWDVQQKKAGSSGTEHGDRRGDVRVRTFPKDSASLGRDTVRALMYYALKVWSDIAPLNFHEVAGSDADIQIDFTKADHNDGYPFDGPGGTVAHAFFPGERFTAGDTHFDDDEAWTFRSPGNLQTVPSNEIGTVSAAETEEKLEKRLKSGLNFPEVER
ncbi:Matrix metalloproteinase-17 [Liparis tanakae]|uniref:Matrix metalloproteinase-17 n=1 Tax=Liparis tanakae TaxID=230148 RepID=A0A4Z2GSK6_9TELE|nr:Matrix metalloproteinase-17 [Liparis tanakae]